MRTCKKDNLKYFKGKKRTLRIYCCDITHFLSELCEKYFYQFPVENNKFHGKVLSDDQRCHNNDV